MDAIAAVTVSLAVVTGCRVAAPMFTWSLLKVCALCKWQLCNLMWFKHNGSFYSQLPLVRWMDGESNLHSQANLRPY